MAATSSSAFVAHGRTAVSGSDGNTFYRFDKSRKSVEEISISGETTRSIALFNDASGDEAQYYNIGDMDGLILAGSFLIAYNRTAASFIAHDLGRGLTACSFRYDGPMWRKGKKSKEKKIKKKKRKEEDLVKRGIMGPMCASSDHDQLSLVFWVEENGTRLNTLSVNPQAGSELRSDLAAG